MDTAILVLLGLANLLLLAVLLYLKSLTTETVPAQPPIPRRNKSLENLLTDQTLEVRRLTNLLVSKNVSEFHAIQAVNQEIQGTTPLTQVETSSDSNQDFLWEGEGLGDEGFDVLPKD